MYRPLLNTAVSRSAFRLQSTPNQFSLFNNTTLLSGSFRATRPAYTHIQEPNLAPTRMVDYESAAKSQTPVPIDTNAADWCIGLGTSGFDWFNRVGLKILILVVATATGLAVFNQPKRQKQTFIVDVKPNQGSNPTFTLQPKETLFKPSADQKQAI